MTPDEILVVNDGSLLLQMMSCLLESRGYPLSLTDSPEEALVRLSARKVHLVILKLNGGQMDRLAVMQMVKEVNPRAKLVILGEGAHLPAEIFEIEADDYVLLPCRPMEVWSRIMSCLKATGQTSTVAAIQEKANAVNGRILNKLGLLFHDLRGGLVSLGSALKHMERKAQGKIGTEVDQLLQDTRHKASHLEGLLEQFLRHAVFSDDYSKAPEACDLREDVVEPVLEELQEELQKNHITIENQLDLLPSHLGLIKGDRLTLQSVFRNLVNNAIKYGGRGCALRLDFTEEAPFLHFGVFNTGPPLTTPEGQALFSRPLTADKKNGGSQGLGLGLYLTRQILRSYGGDIRYEHQGDGSNFHVILPMH
jgi:signal transduction histidine kinase